MALAASAGFVDAWVYLDVTPVFVANMSGNLIHLGMFVGTTDWPRAAATMMALGAFVTGVGVATWQLDRQVRAGREPRPAALLLVESVLLLALPGLLWLGDISYSPTVRARDVSVIVVGAFAMGIQAAALRQVGEVAVATTYGTGSVVRIGEKVVLALRKATPVADSRRRRTVVVLGAVLVSYVGGAAVAAALGRSRVLMLVPAAVLIGAACYVRAADRDADSAGATSPE